MTEYYNYHDKFSEFNQVLSTIRTENTSYTMILQNLMVMKLLYPQEYSRSHVSHAYQIKFQITFLHKYLFTIYMLTYQEYSWSHVSDMHQIKFWLWKQTKPSQIY